MKTWNLVGAVVASLAIFGSSARADNLQSLQQEAAELDGLAHALCEEVRINFGHAPNLPYIVTKVEQLENRVHQSQRIFARPLSQQQLYAQLEVMHDLTHLIEGAVFDAARARGWGHIGVDTRRAEQLLRAIDNTIVHMEGHVAGLQFQHQHYHGWQPQPVNPGWNGNAGGINYRGRGISISFGR